MTTTTISVPDVEAILEVKNEEGDVLLEAEVIYLDHLVSIAQKDIEPENEKAILIWLPKFRDLAVNFLAKMHFSWLEKLRS